MSGIMNNVIGGIFGDEEGNPLAPNNHASGGGIDTILDSDWVRTAFVLPDNVNTDPVDLENRYWTSASSKFTDGRFGCNIGINCHPQLTAYCDPPEVGRLTPGGEPSITDSSGQYGLGGFWTTAYDDPEQIIYLRFGVPEFNSLLSFFTNSFNYGASVLARTGRWPTFLYTTTHFLGQYMALRAMPMITIPLLVFRTADYFFGRQSAKFYHMRPTMHLYWSCVNNLVNTLAINSGIYPRILNMNQDDSQRLGQPMTLDQDNMDIYNRLAPDIFTTENYIDVFALANRAQRLANEMIHQEFESLNEGTSTDWAGFLKREMTGDGKHSTRVSEKDNSVGIFRFIEQFLQLGDFYDAKEQKEYIEQDPRIAKDKDTYDPLYSDSSWNNFKKMLTAEFRQGGSFAVFRVSHTGSKSESFSNNTQPSALENKLNSISSNFQEHRFMFNSVAATGGEIIQGAMNLATDALMGLADGVTFDLVSGIKGLLGEGYVEIPEHWQSSSSSLPTAQYKISLEAWNGSTITRLMKLFVPFAMIAAGAWPRSTGRQSYTSPFLCQIYDQGRVQVPLGMITEFTVSRGVGNIGFTTDGAPLSMDISFTVKDLSRVLHMPLVAGRLYNEPTMIDEDSTITNYLATIAGMSIYSQIYPSTKAKIRAAKFAMNKGIISSPAFWASAIHDSTTQGLGKYLTLGVGVAIEALQRNPDVISGTNVR